MTQPIISASSIEKSYRNGTVATPVLKGVNFSVSHGEMVFLLGPSGSGKSTLLSILGCVLAADAGTLEVCGRNVLALSKRELAIFRRDQLGFVFQRFHLFPGLTCAENVRVPLDLLGIPPRRGLAQARELLAAVGLAEKMDADVRHLSMGQRQRVAVARAMAGEPSLIFADEPTASLDAESGRTTVELLRDLAKSHGKTVVVVTHDSRILNYADRILLLEEGCLRNASAAVASTNAAMAPPLLTLDSTPNASPSEAI